MVRVTSLLLALAATLTLTACGTTPSGGGSGDHSLRVGVSADYPPIIYETGGRITGLEAELARKLAADQGKRIQFVKKKFNDLIPVLEKGQIDVIMSGMSVTQPRSVRVAFGYPYLTIGQKALVPRADARHYTTPWSILMHKGKAGVVKGTTGSYVTQQRLGKAKIVEYGSADSAVKALKAGKIDLFIHDSPMIAWLAAQYEADGLVSVNYPLSEEYLAWAFRKDNDG